MSANATTAAAVSEGTAISAVTISGIQDVSGFLPLLGTEQCEEHVSNVLDRGFLYAAGTPMSMFGSLGIIKAGFTALWISVDRSPIHGPRLLRNAGFFPKGVMGKLAYAMDADDSIYVAEDNIRSILQRYPSIAVHLNIACWRWIQWNLLLSLFTILLGSLGLMSFVYVIKFDLGHRPFSQSWLYPVLRVYGCALVTIVIQLVIQLRILVVVHDRLRFHALNVWFQDNGRLPPHSWNTEFRAAESLSRIRGDILNWNQRKNADPTSKVAEAKPPLKAAPDPGAGEKTAENEKKYCDGLEDTFGATRSFSSFDKNLFATDKHSFLSRLTDTVCVPTLLLAICRILLLGGICAAGVGYVGCFGLIQASNSNNAVGPGTWLAAEVALCIIRLAVWASNPQFDDPPPPIAIQKNEEGVKVTYEIGWTLGDVAVDNVHAVIIGINGTSVGEVTTLKYAESDAKSIADYLRDSLAVPKHQVKLFQGASSGEIKHALQDLATDRNIRLGASVIIYLACHANSHLPSGTGQDESSLVFITTDYSREQPESGLPYQTLLQLIQDISDSKGTNITVILDTCHAGEFGRHAKHDNPSQLPPLATPEDSTVRERERQTSAMDSSRAIGEISEEDAKVPRKAVTRKSKRTTIEYLIGYPSHVLMAACSEGQAAYEAPRGPSNRDHQGGLFTGALLRHLNNMTRDQAKQMTYRSLIDEIRRDFEKRLKVEQTPIVSGNYQNRLLFNGLLANKQYPGSASPEETSVILITASVGPQTSQDPAKVEEEVV